MRIALPHSLGREEARRRLRARSDEIPGMFPAGMADVVVGWPGEDRMTLDITAMGKSLTGAVEVSDTAVTVEVELPAALSFVEPMIRGAIEAKGRKLLT
jgi:hypothetical protein